MDQAKLHTQLTIYGSDTPVQVAAVVGSAVHARPTSNDYKTPSVGNQGEVQVINAGIPYQSVINENVG